MDVVTSIEGFIMKILILLLLIWTQLISAQVDSKIYGITSNVSTQELFLAKVDQNTGVVTTISTNPIGAIYSLNGLAAINPFSGIYYMQTGKGLVGVELTTGNVVLDTVLKTSNMFFDLMQFNIADSTMYGITRNVSTQELFLAKVDQNTGVVTTISTNPIGAIYSLNGLAAINPFSGIYYMQTGKGLVGVELTTGNVVLDTVLKTSNMFFDLMQFNIADSTMYGITRNVSTQELFLAKVDQKTGVVTTISTNPIGAIYPLNGLATINPLSGIYYMQTGKGFVGVELNTGNVVLDTVLKTSNMLFGLMVWSISENHTNIQNKTDASYSVVYPNPTSGQLNIEFSSIQDGAVLDILDASGRKIKTINVDNMNRKSISIESPPGMYYVRIISEDKIWIEKVIKE